MKGSVAVITGAVRPGDLKGRSALWVPASVRRGRAHSSQFARAVRVSERLLRRLPGDLGQRRSIGTAVVDPTTFDPRAGHTVVALDGSDLTLLPAYLRALGTEHGVSLDGRWMLLSPRAYRQQKIVFLAESQAGPDGLVAIKVTQHASVNRRLVNEYDGLDYAWNHELVPRASIPRPLFHGLHAGCAVVAEGGIRGTAFAEQCDGRLRHPRAEAVISWVRQLGRSSRHEVNGQECGAALADLGARVAQVYRDRTAAAVLDEDAERVARADTLPAVFVHGDVGHWNTLVRDDETVSVLDWENAERSGPPLWDLLYFIQTYASWNSARRGVRYTERTFRRQLLDPSSPWHVWLLETLVGQADEIGLDRDLVWPLVRAWWGYSALKESTRRAPAALASALSYRILAVAVRQGPR